jgi:hypothetical protein
MSKSLFILMLVTLLVVIFSACTVKANLQRNDATQKTIKASVLYATPVTFPKNNPKDFPSPEIRATGSFSHVLTSWFVRVNHLLFCIFEMAFQETYSEDLRPDNDVSLTGFFLTLFNAINAPSAPLIKYLLFIPHSNTVALGDDLIFASVTSLS